MPDNNKNNTTNENEFEIPNPHRKNDDITTTEPGKENRGEQNQEEENTGNQTQPNRKQQQVGFETGGNTQSDQQKRIDDDKEREERKTPDNPKYQDADWQQDKLNEANNQKGKEGRSVDEKGKPRDTKPVVNTEANVSDKDKERGSLGDTRKDSITDRPKTETYERASDNDTADAINKGNFQHTRKEEKRKSDNGQSGGAIRK